MPRWHLLKSPGMSLRNRRNNCWYHACLHFLTGVPLFRTSYHNSSSAFSRSFSAAIDAILTSTSRTSVDTFFSLVRDFQGINNRYGQVAVPDFLEHLFNTIPTIFQSLRSNVSVSLQCQRCKWCSISTTSETLIKFYLPPSRQANISFSDLIVFNSEMKFPESAGVNCAKCGVKTAHSSRREHHSDLLFLEIIRVSRANTYWSKNYTCINFPLNGIVFPGSDRKYSVIATCNHKGTLLIGLLNCV